MNDIPSNFKNDFFIYTSKIILERCNLKKEYKELKKRGKVQNYKQLYTHMALIINFLSHNINNQNITNIKRRYLQRASSSVMYRTCIDILKKYKILFICSRDGKESYMKGEFAKGYKFNITEYGLHGDKPVKIKIKDPRIIKKVIKRVDYLQIPRHLSDFFIKEEVEQNVYKHKVKKRKVTIRDIYNNDQIVDRTLKCKIYSSRKTVKNKIKSKKHWLVHKIQKETPFRFMFKDLEDTPMYKIYQLYEELVKEFSSMKKDVGLLLNTFTRKSRHELESYYELAYFNYDALYNYR